MSLIDTHMQPSVRSDTFDLRPVRLSDKGLIEMFAGDARVAAMTQTIPHPLPPGTIDAFLTRVMADTRDEDVWAMDGTKVGGPELMGVISLKRLERSQSEVGYWVAPAFWNTGLASHAVRALVEANPLRNATMFASVFQDNPASARVLTNCGFEYIGDAEAFCVARGAKLTTWTYIRRLT